MKKEDCKTLLRAIGGKENVLAMDVDETAIHLYMDVYDKIDFTVLKAIDGLHKAYIRSGQLHLVCMNDTDTCYHHLLSFIGQGMTQESDRNCTKNKMICYRHVMPVDISHRQACVDITTNVTNVIYDAKVQEGFVLVHAMSNTASVFINYQEDELQKDMEHCLELLIPKNPSYKYMHNSTENNADAHLKRMLLGSECICAITDGVLDIGKWERIFYYEFDGMRKKKILIKLIGI